MLEWIRKAARPSGGPRERADVSRKLDPDVARYVSASYPHNHTYRLSGRELRPRWHLRRRSRRITALYPTPLTSLLDLSCCKGYFVLEAGTRPTCERALGVDVFAHDIDVCRAVQHHTKSRNTAFECMPLHEASLRIDEFGGAFQTALLINCYQYLYFGSSRGAGYQDHDAIFDHLHRVCSGTMIFSNRTELAECQNREEVAGADPDAARHYTTATIRTAAERRFSVTEAGRLGRYPLWLLDRR